MRALLFHHIATTMLASGATDLQRSTPGCPNKKHPNPNGGYYDYCSTTYRDRGGKLFIGRIVVIRRHMP